MRVEHPDISRILQTGLRPDDDGFRPECPVCKQECHVAYALSDALTTTGEEQAQQLEEANKAYQEEQTKLENINTELQTKQERILTNWLAVPMQWFNRIRKVREKRWR